MGGCNTPTKPGNLFVADFGLARAELAPDDPADALRVQAKLPIKWTAPEALKYNGRVVKTPYPDWVLLIALCMILAGVLPIPVVLLLRRFQCLAFDVDIHQGSIRRIETTVSTKEMMSDQDVLSPESAPPAPAQLFAEAATRFTIGDFDGADSGDERPSKRVSANIARARPNK
ncbi:uncharacterized protein [Choristoneura fumiferana]|uniref:uncharacterized protein n=1 Tax=Choristoneura fumiferana TaxID=7141 RepID=UPI003D158EB6